jgi:hypothetical protein
MENQPTEKNPVPAIHAAMVAAMKAIGHVAKTKKNASQGYSFRGYDDVYLACRDALGEAGIHVTHKIQSQQWDERPSKNGGVLIHLRAVFVVRFTAIDGSYTETEVFAEAMDSGDKAANKAMSMAMKYALVDTFLIPTEEKRDTEHESPEIAAKKAAPALEASPMLADTKQAIAAVTKQLGMKGAEVADFCKKHVGKGVPSDTVSWSEVDAQKLLTELRKLVAEAV